MGYIQSNQWLDIAEVFSLKIREEKEKVIGPACVELLLECRNDLPDKINALDFGGGDGFVLSLIIPHINFQWYYYDPSVKQNEIFKNRTNLSSVTCLENLNDKKFNVIMCNHVLNAMENVSELEDLFKKLYLLVSIKGLVVITINHPLYLNKDHKYYSCTTTHLNYNDGINILTKIHDNKKNEHIVFYDTYWSCDIILKLIERTGFKCLKSRDLTISGWSNPSYLQLTLTKSDI